MQTVKNIEKKIIKFKTYRFFASRIAVLSFRPNCHSMFGSTMTQRNARR